MLQFDYHQHPYISRRETTVGRKGMVATSQPLAAQAGLDILKLGGNAIDAAIATASALTVVEPTSNGIGGDAFAIAWVNEKLVSLNASGRAPQSLTTEAVKALGHEKMPTFGTVPITVPGAPSAWAELSAKYGKLPLTQVLQPAITLAEEGYPLSPTLANYWGKAYNAFRQRGFHERPEFAEWFRVFAPNGRAPKVGEIWRSPDHAKTLRLIAETNGEAFYHGELADKIANFLKEHNAFLTKEDLQAHQPDWVTPVSVNYKGYDIWEIPPNGQGMIALMALQGAKNLTFTERETIQTYHQQIELMKHAMTHGKATITDIDEMKEKVEYLLSEEMGAHLASGVQTQAADPKDSPYPKSGTVYLATADGEGNMVSFIQSNYMGFGSGVVVPGTGIALQNRGHDFSLDENDVNGLKPGKRTYHTIIPGFITKDNSPVGPFGVMGGYMQPQGHMQVAMNMIDFDLHPQAALDAPRWQWIENKTVWLEPHVPTHIAQGLERLGHQVRITTDGGPFGRGQIIIRDPETGVLFGGTESRADGAVAVW